MNISQTQGDQRALFKENMAPDSPRDFWDAYRPFIHSKKIKQANDIILKENNIVTDKKEIPGTVQQSLRAHC